MDTATKDRLAERFRLYLDQPPAATQANASLFGDAEENAPKAPDLFSLLAEVAALKNEVKLESRQFKMALDEFRGLFEALQSAQTRLEQEQQRRREQERGARRREHKALLLELLELRDRLQAGQASTAGYKPKGLFGRRRAREFAAAMAEGLAMNLRRLDETLARRGVRPLPALGKTFDPHRMHAAELAFDPEIPVGQVIAERRPGFLLEDELLRIAEVVVNRPEAVGPAEPPGPASSVRTAAPTRPEAAPAASATTASTPPASTPPAPAAEPINQTPTEPSP
ncbi:nucleotide exchange factor GrpE [Halochromatium roseum]|uniref:nucleotide exchange factor GrpE n=1 Tax=Halochromatium roseum TaxID=391920 RepID=UPI001912E0B6|nr:nucleotide exchange factor GrpE [Halochromatium roseum]MBK5938656.1 nucleotide exchange factor GrpE [Halochromatium roseum]